MSDTIILRPQVGTLSNTEWLMKYKEKGVYVYFDQIHFDGNDNFLQLERNGIDSNVAIIDMSNYNTDIHCVIERYENGKKIQLH